MKTEEIIEKALEFPYKNLGTFAIFVVLSTLASSFAMSGAISTIMGIKDSLNILIGILSLIFSLLVGLVLSGYLISVVKSGIEHDENVPDFEWKENFITGINNFIVTFIYTLIPSIIVIIVGFLTNVPGSFLAVVEEINTQISNVYMGLSPTVAFEAITQTIEKIPGTLVIPIIVAIVLFIIFAFLLTMAEARLAKTGELKEALNIVEAAKDLMRIGIGKFILLFITIFVTVIVIMMVTSFIFSLLPFLSVLSMIITPYLLLFTQRAVGLLYSDIA